MSDTCAVCDELIGDEEYKRMEVLAPTKEQIPITPDTNLDEINREIQYMHTRCKDDMVKLQKASEGGDE